MINVNAINQFLKKIDDGMSAKRIYDWDRQFYLIEVKMDGSNENYAYPFILLRKSDGNYKNFTPSENPEKYLNTISKDPLYSE